jgi:hypothetical protein
MAKKADRAAAARARPVIQVQYQVRAHLLELTGNVNGWAAIVDGVPLGPSFGSSADAWTAGVTEAYRLDALAAGSPPSGNPG